MYVFEVFVDGKLESRTCESLGCLRNNISGSVGGVLQSEGLLLSRLRIRPSQLKGVRLEEEPQRSHGLTHTLL